MGGLLLAACLFAPWYETDPSNPNAQIDGARGSLSGWEVHPLLRWLLLAAAIAPLILIYIVVRQHELSWPRGELTAVVGADRVDAELLERDPRRPGEPSGAIGLQLGWYLARCSGRSRWSSAARCGRRVRARRKPPGVL